MNIIRKLFLNIYLKDSESARKIMYDDSSDKHASSLGSMLQMKIMIKIIEMN